MKLLVFTANHPRHMALLDGLMEDGHDVVAVIEPKTWLLPESPIQREYWTRVAAAEAAVFGEPKPLTMTAIVLRPGELSRVWTFVPLALADRLPIVFSSSYITGSLCDDLIAKGALNLHGGIAPEYRGSAPNAWAYYDGHEDLIGAQIQLLNRTLDGGMTLRETLNWPHDTYFLRSMNAIKDGIEELRDLLALEGQPYAPLPSANHRAPIRYSRHADWTDEIAAAILRKVDG